MPADGTFEDDLTRALSLTSDGFHAETGPLIEAGMARGRVRRRRRATAAVAGGVTALALVGVGGVFLSAPTRSAAPVNVAAPTASATPTATPTAVPTVSADEVTATFKALLPAGQVDDVQARGAGGSGEFTNYPNVSLRFDDGHGAARLSAGVTRVSDPSAADTACPDHKLVPYDACTSNKLADGSVLTVFQGYEYPDRRVDTKYWSATLTGTDGRRITISEWNAGKEKDAPITRPTPPLTPAQLTAAATDRSWDRIVAAIAMPAQHIPPSTGRTQFPGEQVLATIAGILPSGLKEADTDSSEGYANFTVNDGKGACLVEVNVQDWRAGLKTHQTGGTQHGDSVAQVFTNAQKLPDGTLVTREKHGINPNRWVVDTLRPDGLRVVISVYNSAGLQEAATRTSPALTFDQLQAVATSTAWPSLPKQPGLRQ